MTEMIWIVIGLLVVVALLLLLVWPVWVYNGLVRARNGFRNAFAQIDVQLKRRHDLIPNLVEVAKRYMAHERETMEAVIEARSAAETARSAAAADPGKAGTVAALAQAERGLGGTLGRLFALSEAYPDLKSNETMQQLQEELASTENKVAFARQAYNDAVMAYNNRRETFPANVVAGAMGFVPATPYEVEEAAVREAVKVDFGEG